MDERDQLAEAIGTEPSGFCLAGTPGAKTNTPRGKTMKTVTLSIGCILLCAPVSAMAQPDQLAHDMEMKRLASAAHEQAVKAGDKAAIARADAQLQTATEDIYDDKQEASWKVPANATGPLRAVDAELIQAKEESSRAYASGNEAAKTAARQHVRELYQRRWAIVHAKG